MIIGKAHDGEEDGEDDETTQLDGLSAEGVQSSNRYPVAGNRTSKDDDHISDSSVVQHFIGASGVLRRVADRFQNVGVVQRKTVD